MLISSKDIDEIPHKHLWCNNNQVIIFEEICEIIKEYFKSRPCIKQDRVNKMKDGGFIFDFIDGLSSLCHEISLNCSGSNIDCHCRIENKKQQWIP